MGWTNDVVWVSIYEVMCGVMWSEFMALTMTRYEVNFQNGLSCGGAYVKLLTSAENLDMVKGFLN